MLRHQNNVPCLLGVRMKNVRILFLLFNTTFLFCRSCVEKIQVRLCRRNEDEGWLTWLGFNCLLLGFAVFSVFLNSDSGRALDGLHTLHLGVSRLHTLLCWSEKRFVGGLVHGLRSWSVVKFDCLYLTLVHREVEMSTVVLVLGTTLLLHRYVYACCGFLLIYGIVHDSWDLVLSCLEVF